MRAWMKLAVFYVVTSGATAKAELTNSADEVSFLRKSSVAPEQRKQRTLHVEHFDETSDEILNEIVEGYTVDPCQCSDPEFTCIPPDGIQDESQSMWVGYCDAAVFGSCENGLHCCDCGHASHEEACSGMKSWIRKDNSCKGNNACKGTNAPLIAQSCHGDFSCQRFGDEGLSSGRIINSCIGSTSCVRAGANGDLGDLIDSCHGKYACGDMANGGIVGNVQSSCHGEGTGEADAACAFAGAKGEIGNIFESCIGPSSCYVLAGSMLTSGPQSALGVAGDISYSCYGRGSCRYLAQLGIVGKISGSCCGDASGDTVLVGQCESYCKSPTYDSQMEIESCGSEKNWDGAFGLCTAQWALAQRVKSGAVKPNTPK